jgi:hypothetical protein
MIHSVIILARWSTCHIDTREGAKPAGRQLNLTVAFRSRGRDGTHNRRNERVIVNVGCVIEADAVGVVDTEAVFARESSCS